MPYSVYILFSEKLNRYYVGHTENIDQRIIQHNTGYSKYTAKANDWKLCYLENFESRTLAQNREKEIKRKKSRKYIKWLIKHRLHIKVRKNSGGHNAISCHKTKNNLQRRLNLKNQIFK